MLSISVFPWLKALARLIDTAHRVWPRGTNWHNRIVRKVFPQVLSNREQQKTLLYWQQGRQYMLWSKEHMPVVHNLSYTVLIKGCVIRIIIESWMCCWSWYWKCIVVATAWILKYAYPLPAMSTMLFWITKPHDIALNTAPPCNTHIHRHIYSHTSWYEIT